MPTVRPIPLARIRTEYLQSAAFSRLGHATQSYYRRSLENLKLSRLNTSGLCGPTIRRLLAQWEDAPGAYNKARSALSAMISWAELEYPVQIHNPVSAVPQKSLGSIKRWAPGDAQRAIDATEGSLKTAIVLMDITAARLSDVLRFKPDDITGGCLEFIQQKTGAKVSVRLKPGDQDFLDGLGAVRGHHFIGNHVLPLSESMLQMRWLSVRERIFGAGCKHTLHGIRKGAACEAAEGGADPLRIRNMLGHKTIRASMIYVAEVDAAKMAQQAQEMRRSR